MRNPHDTFFHQLFGRLDVAAAQLRRMVPAPLASRLLWGTLRTLPTVSQDALGTERRSDLVFSVRSRDGEPLLLLLHLEHQRTCPPLMALRMCGYAGRIWQSWVRHERQRTGKPVRTLPALVPAVVYNGASPWHASTSIEGLVRPPSALGDLGPHHLRGSFLLLDLSAMDDETLLASATHAHLRLGLWLMKHIDDADLWPGLVAWAESLVDLLGMSDPVDRFRRCYVTLQPLRGRRPREPWSVSCVNSPRTYRRTP